MIIGEINFYFIVFFIIFSSVLINVTSALHLLLTAEILWINLYLLALFIGLVYDNLNFLSLTFFLLILSAVEFGIGLVIMLMQNLLFRSIKLDSNSSNFSKFSNRFLNNLNVNAVRFYNY